MKKPAPQSNRNFRIAQVKFNRQLKSKRIDHYLLKQVLGNGATATVHKAQEIHTKLNVAAKFFKSSQNAQTTLKNFTEQAQILRSVDHSSIIKIYEALNIDLNYIIITEFVQGSQLFNYLLKHGAMKQSLAARIFYQIITAVKYLHQKGIVHRDIKAQNIMIDYNFKAKLVDFGLATHFKKEDNKLLQKFCGSPSYIAPQLLQNKPYDGTKLDIWCLGVVLYVMLQANLPFDNETSQQRCQNIKKMNWITPRISSPEAIQLYKLIFKNSHQRISIDGLLNSKFFRKHSIFHVQLQSNFKSQNKIDLLHFQYINKIQEILGFSEKDIRSQIKLKKLGPAYSIYQLLLKQDRKNFSIQFETKSKTLTVKSRKKSQQQKKKFSNTNIRKIFRAQKISTPQGKVKIRKQVYPLLKQNVKICFKKFQLVDQLQFDEKLFYQQKTKLRQRKFPKQKNAQFNKRMYALQMMPRLREWSPVSTKRVLDCLSKYK